MPIKEPVVYIRGRFLPASEAHISIYDFGIVLGATVTDLLRTFKGRPYRLEDHVRRFYDSCKYARIEPSITAKEACDVTQELIRHNHGMAGADAELAVAFFITPGENLVYAGSAAPGSKLTPTFCIHSFPLPFLLFRRFFENGLHLVTPSTRHVPPDCVDPKIKHRSRMHWWLAEQEAHLADPTAMPLLLDRQGNLTEQAVPISCSSGMEPFIRPLLAIFSSELAVRPSSNCAPRSEERRVGKECRSRWS